MASTSIVYRQQNEYILTTFKNATRYEDLVPDVIVKLNQGIKFKNPKQILFSLRELCMHSRSSFGTMPDKKDIVGDALIEALVGVLKNTSDLDTDKKIVRTAYYLLTQALISYPRKSMKDRNVASFVQHLQYAIKQQEGFRMYFWLSNLDYYCALYISDNICMCVCLCYGVCHYHWNVFFVVMVRYVIT